MLLSQLLGSANESELSKRFGNIVPLEKIGLELGENGIPKRSCKMPVYVPCEQVTVKPYRRMWDTIKKG